MTDCKKEDTPPTLSKNFFLVIDNDNVKDLNDVIVEISNGTNTKRENFYGSKNLTVTFDAADKGVFYGDGVTTNVDIRVYASSKTGGQLAIEKELVQIDFLTLKYDSGVNYKMLYLDFWEKFK